MDKKLLRVLAGESVSPPPVWLMRQAGRYLPEYRQLRSRHASFLDFCLSPRAAAEAILFSDILLLLWALGRDLDFVEGEGPKLAPLQAEEISRLDLSALPSRLAPVGETIRLIREALPGAVTLIGFAGAPFTLAAYAIEGGGSADHLRTRLWAHHDPQGFSRLIEILTEAVIQSLTLQVQAGAEAVMLFDSWAGLLPPRGFARYVITPARRIVSALRARFPHLPLIGFPRLASAQLGPYAQETGLDGVGLDTAADPALVRHAVGAKTALQGNLDPAALLAGGAALAAETENILTALSGHPHIFNLGHGVLPATPPEHVAALLALVRGTSRQAAS
jgi:uroporphyrinogen decarboxylase